MKKLILSTLIFAGLATSAFALTGGTYTPSENLNLGCTTGLTPYPNANYVFFFNSSQSHFMSAQCTATVLAQDVLDTNSDTAPSTYTLVEFQKDTPCWVYGDYDTCIANASSTGTYIISNPAPAVSAISSMVSSSSDKFASTTGFSPAGAVSFMSTHLLNPIMGTGLGTLKAILPWIVALIAIGGIIYLAYRGFRFFRN